MKVKVICCAGCVLKHSINSKQSNRALSLFFPSLCKGEDEGEGPYPARYSARD